MYSKVIQTLPWLREEILQNQSSANSLSVADLSDEVPAACSETDTVQSVDLQPIRKQQRGKYFQACSTPRSPFWKQQLQKTGCQNLVPPRGRPAQIQIWRQCSLSGHFTGRCFLVKARFETLQISESGCKLFLDVKQHFALQLGEREYSQLLSFCCLLAAMSCDKYSVSISLIQAGLFFIFVGLHDKVSFNASVIIRRRLCCECGRKQWYLFLMNLYKTIYQNNFRMMSAYNLQFKRLELVS